MDIPSMDSILVFGVFMLFVTYANSFQEKRRNDKRRSSRRSFK